MFSVKRLPWTVLYHSSGHLAYVSSSDPVPCNLSRVQKRQSMTPEVFLLILHDRPTCVWRSVALLLTSKTLVRHHKKYSDDPTNTGFICEGMRLAAATCRSSGLTSVVWTTRLPSHVVFSFSLNSTSNKSVLLPTSIVTCQLIMIVRLTRNRREIIPQTVRGDTAYVLYRVACSTLVEEHSERRMLAHAHTMERNSKHSLAHDLLY